MSLKIAIICKPGRFSSEIQYWATGLIEGKWCQEKPYHVAWYCTERDTFLDMNWHFREVPFDHYRNRKIFYFEPPANMEYEDVKDEIGKHVYGVLDVLFFPLLKIFKINMFGDHCSEIINDQLRNKHGNITPWNIWQAPPSPCLMLKWCKNHLANWGRA